eukprot:9844254-Heterocapsa_arctica.AAC.1
MSSTSAVRMLKMLSGETPCDESSSTRAGSMGSAKPRGVGAGPGRQVGGGSVSKSPSSASASMRSASAAYATWRAALGLRSVELVSTSSRASRRSERSEARV